MKRYKNNFPIILILLSLFFSVKMTNTSAEDNELIGNMNPLTTMLTDGLKDKANVAIDPDEGRTDFDHVIKNPSEEKTPTSVTVEVSDQISNLDTYKKRAQATNTYASVNNWGELKAAYSDNSKTYIEVTNHIVAASNVNRRDLGWRQTSVIIDGGGKTINMAGAAFNVGTSATARGSIFTITNVDLIHWETGTVSGDSTYADGVIDSRRAAGGYGYWQYNIDNVTLQGRDGVGGTANFQPRRLLDAEDSQVTLSGDIVVSAKQELMQIDQVDIADNAHVELQRTAGTTGYSMFYFMAISADNKLDTGYAHTFTVGDGATIIGNELSSYNSNNYPLVYYGFNGMTVGDNVKWSQDGFQMLLDLNRYSGTSLRNREVTFGQNLNMVATRTVGYNSLFATNNSKVTFNSGTVLDLQQWNNNTVVRTDTGSTITFISPKSLYLSRKTSSGDIGQGALFTGQGTFSMNNSLISTWQGRSNIADVPVGDRQSKFTNMSVVGNTTTITNTAGITQTSNIVDRTTRELKTNSIDPGTIKLNYVDQYGKTLKTVPYPINKTDNYIGQYQQLRTEEYAINNMPDNYMWAIGNQVPESAALDGQSGGDSTTTADNGDEYGQANFAIVPMEGVEYTYNIYVYGHPTTGIEYEYKDLKTGKNIESAFSNSQKEKARTATLPANYGNKIDWTNNYYTNTNVPEGYHYATPSELKGNIQPKETIVGLAPELTTLYVYPDKQTVIVTFENSDGTPLENQKSPISIDGYSGEEISYKDLLEGKITQQGSAFEPGTFKFDYTDNKGSDIDKTPQYLTIKLKYVLSNMILKQVYKGTDEPIYSDLKTKKPVDNTISYEETINDKLEDSIERIISEGKFSLNYEGYDTVGIADYKVYVDGVEVDTTTVPSGDFTVVYEYNGQLKFKDVPEILDFGSIEMSEGSSTSPLSDSSDKTLSIINTVQNNSWKLSASMPKGITKKDGEKEVFLGEIIYNGSSGVPQIIGKTATTIETQEDDNLFSKLELKTAKNELLLQQHVGNSLGAFEGVFVWSLEDSP